MKAKRRKFSISLSALSILSITAASVVAVSVCIAIFSTVCSNALIKDAKLSSEQAVGQVALAVNNNLDSMRQKLEFIEETVADCSDSEDFYNKISVITRMQRDIYAVTVYSENGDIIAATNGDTSLKKQIYKDLSFDKALFESAEGFALSSPHVQTVFEGGYPWVVTLAVKSDTPVLENGVYIAIDYEFSEIAKYIDNVGVGRHGYCFITDGGGNIIYHPQQQLIFSGIKSENTEFIKGLSEGVHYEENVIYTLTTTEDGLWRVVGLSFTDELTVEIRTQIIFSIVISFLFCGIIALIVLRVYSKIVNAPVRSLIKAMKTFEKHAENFRYSGGNESVTELRIISSSFEHMAKTIQNLMERVHIEEKELRKTELKALQAQINPHFLYNTLDSIQWMCEQGNTKDAAEMVRALARLFRISISRGRELITIREELQQYAEMIYRGTYKNNPNSKMLDLLKDQAYELFN